MDDKHEIEDESYEDTEYQFSDEEHTPEETYDEESYVEGEEAGAAAGGLLSKFPFLKALDRLKHKRLILVAGALILIVIIYNLLTGRGKPQDQSIDQVAFTPGTEKVAAPTTTPAQKLAAQLKTAEEAKTKEPKKPAPFDDIDKSVFAAPSATQPGMPSGVSAAEVKQAMAGAVQKIQSQNQQLINMLSSRYDEKMRSLDQMSQANSQSMKMLREEIAQLREQINVLAQGVARNSKNQQRLLFNQGISFDASGAAAEPMPMTSYQPAPQGVIVQKVSYKLQAVVPGRAWLKSSTGETITVSQGDTVPGMGLVVGIDAINGIVTLSSGRMITSQ